MLRIHAAAVLYSVSVIAACSALSFTIFPFCLYPTLCVYAIYTTVSSSVCNVDCCAWFRMLEGSSGKPQTGMSSSRYV